MLRVRPTDAAALALVLVTLGCAGTLPPSPNTPGNALASALSETALSAREQTADQQIHQLLNRLAFGARPGDVEAVRAMGVDAWVERQLYPERIADTATEQFVTRFPTLGKTGEQLLADYPPPAAALAQA